MSKRDFLIFSFIFIVAIIPISGNDDYPDRTNSSISKFDCLDEAEKEAEKIKSAEDCFKKSPIYKWKCCYFEYKEDNEMKNGCMKVRKNNETDMNDLKNYISKLSSYTVFNCRQVYLTYSLFMSLALLFLLF